MSIKRIYSYKTTAHKVLTIDDTSPFINCLEQVHSFIDCCHDQFDPARMSSFFKVNKKETEFLRNLIWYFSFGETDGNEKFHTNAKEYQKSNNIHKLAEALERKPSDKFGFSIKLPGAAVTTGCDYELPEMIELPWKDDSNNRNLGETFATYKFHNYSPANSAGAGTTLQDMMKSNNTAYILDCGKRLFHENFTNKGKGISIFSGIIDSSTVNDPVLDISDCPQAIEKLQFLIPFINIPRSEVSIDMYCTFANYNEAIRNDKSPVLLFLAFLTKQDIVNHPLLQTSDPTTNMAHFQETLKGQCMVVTGTDIPDLTNVTNYLAGPIRGCFHSLTNTFLKTTGMMPVNPCYQYEPLTKLLFTKLQNHTHVLWTETNFQKIFQIRFKHIGDKTRLIDAVMVNSLSAQYLDYNIPLCHTGTIDTFSNRYALLGNLYTITPIKKSNLYINDNKILSAEQLLSIQHVKETAKARFFSEQKILFDMTAQPQTQTQIQTLIAIIPLLLEEKIKKFRENLKLRVKKTRSISCVSANYWDVLCDDKFIDNAYTAPDIALIEFMETMLGNILKCYESIMATSFYTKMSSFFAEYDTSLKDISIYEQPLHILLDLLRLSTLISAGGITVQENILSTQKPILIIATSMAKADFSPEIYCAFGKTSNVTAGGNKNFYKKLYDKDIISETQMIKQMKSLDITFDKDNQSCVIDSNIVLLKLQKNYIAEKMKHEIYESEIDESIPAITINDIFISEMIQNEMNQNDDDKMDIISDDDSFIVGTNLNPVFNQEVVIISSLYKYQFENALEDTDPNKPSPSSWSSSSSSSSSTRKKRKISMSPRGENYNPQVRTSSTPPSSPTRKKKKSPKGNSPKEFTRKKRKKSATPSPDDADDNKETKNPYDSPS